MASYFGKTGILKVMAKYGSPEKVCGLSIQSC